MPIRTLGYARLGAHPDIDADAAGHGVSGRKERSPSSPAFRASPEDSRITTLGRGGSDTSAVALAAALRPTAATSIPTSMASIPPIRASSPKRADGSTRRLRRNAGAGLARRQGSADAFGRTRHGAHYRMPRAVVLSTFDNADPQQPPGTLICDEGEIMEQTHRHRHRLFARRGARSRLRSVSDQPGVAAAIFGPLAEAGVNVDMIVQNVSGTARQPTSPSRCQPPISAIAGSVAQGKRAIGFARLYGATDVAKISAIGVGMRSHAGVAAEHSRLWRSGINIRAITTSEIKFSVLIDAAFTELAVRTLHSLYGLDEAA